MKKTLLYLFIVFAVVPLTLFLLWYFTERRPLRVFIMDKTVMTKQGQEHRSFNWVLTHDRYVSPFTNKPYRIPLDYLGFFPLDKHQYVIRDLENYTNEELDSLVAIKDVCFYTDVYGVYHNDWYPQGLNILERSDKIYGGLTKTDFSYLKKMKEAGKLVITEFNLIASPTGGRVKSRTEKLFGIKWTGWTGRYFESLDTALNKELPQWVTKMYMRDNLGNWPFKKSGIVFVSDKDEICVLEEGSELIYPVPIIRTFGDARKHYGVADSVSYPYWFDITYAEPENEVISHYFLRTNQYGDSLLNLFGIPKIFPALIREPREKKFFYLCGDFSDNPIQDITAYFKYIKKFSFLLETGELSDRRSFFWNYYYPFVSKVLDDYDKTLTKPSTY